MRHQSVVVLSLHGSNTELATEAIHPRPPLAQGCIGSPYVCLLVGFSGGARYRMETAGLVALEGRKLNYGSQEEEPFGFYCLSAWNLARL